MVEIKFSGKNESHSLVKVVLAYGKINKKLWEHSLTETESALLISAANRENVKSKAGEFISIETTTGKIICAIIAPAPTSIELQQLGGKLYNLLKKHSTAAIMVEKPTNSKLKISEIAYNLGFGLEMASYRFDKYITKRKPEDFPKLETVSFIHHGPTITKDGYAPYAALSNGVRYARDLTNEPANNMTPVIMADDIKRLEYLGLEVEILDEKAMKEQEFTLALSVSQGSANPPRIASLKWKGKAEEEKYSLGLVGKGVTFDSGGISLKPGNGMWDMKQDMAGAAAVVGAMKTAALQKLPLNVVAVVGLVENMPSGTATRPGDVVKSMSGQTVEILNTDAEGRLVLADCLWYIQEKFAVKTIVDIATLTGAIIIALGKEMAGVMGNNQPLINTIIKAGNSVNEKAWQLPVTKEYDQMMNSSIADMKNISEGRSAGSIAAACFLQRYVQKDVKWAHLDIAGMDKEDKGRPLTPKGASGFGVQLLNALMKNL